MSDTLNLARELMLAMLLAVTVFYDLRYRIVPNPLIAVALTAGLVLTGLEGIEALFKTILVAMLVSYPFYYGYQRGWMGGGDVKLVTAISLIAGEQLAKVYFLVGTCGGGIASLVSLLLSASKDSRDWNDIEGKRSVMVPYAAAYAAAGLVAQIVLWRSRQ